MTPNRSIDAGRPNAEGRALIASDAARRSLPNNILDLATIFVIGIKEAPGQPINLAIRPDAFLHNHQMLSPLRNAIRPLIG